MDFNTGRALAFAERRNTVSSAGTRAGLALAGPPPYTRAAHRPIAVLPSRWWRNGTTDTVTAAFVRCGRRRHSAFQILAAGRGARMSVSGCGAKPTPRYALLLTRYATSSPILRGSALPAAAEVAARRASGARRPPTQLRWRGDRLPTATHSKNFRLQPVFVLEPGTFERL